MVRALLVGVLTLCPLLAPLSAAAQDESITSVLGRILLPSGEPARRQFKVVLRTAATPLRQSVSDKRGEFRFVDVPTGRLVVEVSDETNEYASVSELVDVLPRHQTIANIYLSPNPSVRNKVIGGGTASIEELEARVPAAARREYEHAVKLSNDGDRSGAISALKKAIEIYPDYSVARNDLGVQYFRADRVHEAAEQFEAAIKIDPNAFRPRLNLGLVQVDGHNYGRAAELLRQAVALDGTQPSSHLYLGVSLIETNELAEANEELKKALLFGEDAYAAAHFYLAVLNLKRGSQALAREEAREYLAKAPNGELAPAARALLNRLQQ